MRQAGPVRKDHAQRILWFFLVRTEELQCFPYFAKQHQYYTHIVRLLPQTIPILHTHIVRLLPQTTLILQIMK
jgi:hypothetical protein